MQADTLTLSRVQKASYNKWLERDLLPGWLIRLGIRRLLAHSGRPPGSAGEAAEV